MLNKLLQKKLQVKTFFKFTTKGRPEDTTGAFPPYPLVICKNIKGPFSSFVWKLLKHNDDPQDQLTILTFEK